MSFNYTPHMWEQRDELSKERMNNIETGLSNIVNNLQSVAETGSYNDLIDKPLINGQELSGGVNINSFKIEISNAIPDVDTAQKGILYLVPRQEANEDDKYDEYVLAEGAIEKIGGLSKNEANQFYPIKYNITIDSPVWIPSGTIFKASIAIENIDTSNDYTFIADLIQTDDEDLNTIARENWDSIVRMTIENKVLTFYSTKEFDSLNLQLLAFHTNIT